MKSATDGMEEIELGMSNFDHTVDDGFAEALRAHPAKVYGYHSAYNFSGKVWFFEGKYYEEVWVHHSICEIFNADTLEELMDVVNEQYGSR